MRVDTVRMCAAIKRGSRGPGRLTHSLEFMSQLLAKPAVSLEAGRRFQAICTSMPLCLCSILQTHRFSLQPHYSKQSVQASPGKGSVHFCSPELHPLPHTLSLRGGEGVVRGGEGTDSGACKREMGCFPSSVGMGWGDSKRSREMEQELRLAVAEGMRETEREESQRKKEETHEDLGITMERGGVAGVSKLRASNSTPFWRTARGVALPDDAHGGYQTCPWLPDV